MASYGAAAIVTKTAFFSSGPIGWVAGAGLIAGAALIDQKIIQGLQGKPREQDRSPSLLGLPVQSTEAGAPRVWALGRRVRVPCHVMWQSEKEISVTVMPGSKGVPSVAQNQVLVDCAVAVNDRQTMRVMQMISQGQLLFWTTRNIITVETSGITVSESGGNLVLTMVDTFEQDWSDKFQADDNVILSGFVCPSGPNINNGYWRVVSATGHGLTPSALTLSPYSGQTLVGLSATAGSSATPALVSRLDDVIARHDITGTLSTQVVQRVELSASSLQHLAFPDVFNEWDIVRLTGFSPPDVNGIPLQVRRIRNGYVWLNRTSGTFGGTTYDGMPVTAGTSTNSASISFWTPQTATNGILDPSFVPTDHFHEGDDTQTAGSIIEGVEGVGNVSGYRGVAYQELENFNVTRFGGGVGPQTEALIEVDSSMSWPRAFQLVCERGGVAQEFVNTEGVFDDSFEGMMIRGYVPAAQSLQDMLLAKQVATQDRDGVLCFSAIENLDVVQVVNGTGDEVSDLAAYIDGEQPTDTKLGFDDASPEDAPTSVAVRHQDPDNFYAAGYQVFGVRNPGSSEFENRQEIDLSSLVMTPKQAMDLATTIARRAYVNSRTVRMQLPASYLHVLENDLLTVTTDEGEDLTVRVIRRDIGSNFLVQVTGVVEDVELAVSGSPVQSGAGITNRIPQRLPPIVGRVLDIPPMRDGDSYAPGLWLAGAPLGDGAWAGATIYRSTDGEQSWDIVGNLPYRCTVGTSTTALAGAAPSETHGSSSVVWDAVSTITVTFDALGQLPIASFPEQLVLDGLNWFHVQSDDGTFEIIGARDATQVTSTEYIFSYLLRGLRGTAGGIATSRAAGAKVTAMGHPTEAYLLWLPCEGVASGAVQSFRFVAPGEDVSDVESVGITARWRNCSPFPVRDVTKTITGTTSVRFEVDHWTRRVLPVGSTGPYALDEPYEEYRFDMWNAAGTAIVHRRTITSRGTGSPTLRDKWVDFSAAECTAAGYTLGPGETFWIDVVQIGDYGESPSNKQEL